MTNFRQLFPILMLLFILPMKTEAKDNEPSARKPLKVFILVGQSNMQGHAHVRTMGQMKKDANTRELYRALVDDEGKARVHENVWISYLSSSGIKSGQLTTGFGANQDKIGPELAFGVYAAKHFGEPILIIKTAWGGKSIHTDFRPPNAKPFEFREEQLKQFEKQGKDIEKIIADKSKASGHY